MPYERTHLGQSTALVTLVDSDGEQWLEIDVTVHAPSGVRNLQIYVDHPFKDGYDAPVKGHILPA